MLTYQDKASFACERHYGESQTHTDQLELDLILMVVLCKNTTKKITQQAARHISESHRQTEAPVREVECDLPLVKPSDWLVQRLWKI